MVVRTGSRLCLAGTVLWVGVSSCGRSSASHAGGEQGVAGRAGAGGSASGHGGGAGRGAGRGGDSIEAGSTGFGRGGDSIEAGSTGFGEGGARAGRGGQSGSATVGGGGSADLGCAKVICTPEEIVGHCPEGAPAWGTPCTTFGTTCAYCNFSRECPDMLEGVLTQCCDTEDGQVWAHNCLTTCVDSGTDAQGGAGAGGQTGGVAGEGGACGGPPPGCCNTDADCARAFECVPATNAPHGGVCKPQLADQSQCWRDADCPAGYHCDDVLLNACGDGGQDESRGDCRPD